MKRLIAILLAAAAIVAGAAHADSPAAHAPTWTQAAVAAAIERVDTQAELQVLFERARAGNDAALLARIEHLRARDDWPAPAREFVLFSFTEALSDLPPGTVDTRVIERLSAIRPEVRVPHPDDDRLGIVMFNIPAAAAGVATEWRRQAASQRAVALLTRDTGAWIDGFLNGDRAERNGFLDALAAAGEELLRALADAVAPRLESEPALATAAARAGILLCDGPLFAQALSGAPPAGLAELARQAAGAFGPVQARQTVAALAAAAPAPTTAVVLAEWAPLLLQDVGGADFLFELLDDEDLGLAAALALARNGDEATRARLAMLAAQPDGKQAQRAAIALGGPLGEREAR